MKWLSRFALVMAFCAVSVLPTFSQQQPRVFLMFTAKVEPGHMAEYREIVKTKVLPILKKNEVELIGIFASALGGDTNELHLLTAYKDFAHYQKSTQDPELVKLQQENFERIRIGTTRLLAPVDFSPLK